MKCVILAAGYATRLYPLTENFPKPLLDVQGKSILDWLIDDVDRLGTISEYVVISNSKFFKHFQRWASERDKNITVLDDGTTSNETRLGAVKDIWFAIEKLQLNEDLLVVAGDNLLDFSLTKFISYAQEKQTSCIMRYFEPRTEKLKKSGVVQTDEQDKVLQMQEKPQTPCSSWACPPFYYYVQADVPLVKKGIDSGCGTDAPGSFIAWLCTQTTVHAMEMPGKRYDIGNLESYQQVQQAYQGITK